MEERTDSKFFGQLKRMVVRSHCQPGWYHKTIKRETFGYNKGLLTLGETEQISKEDNT